MHSQPHYFDFSVLGAGIVGISTALQLQEAGFRVALLDHAKPGQGTSYGNAGIIERASYYPYAFPRQWGKILAYALNRRTDAYIDLVHAMRIAPQLLRYWRNSAPAAHHKMMLHAKPLIEQCVQTHLHLAQAAKAMHLLHSGGWIKLARHTKTLVQLRSETAKLQEFGIHITEYDTAGVHQVEPSLHRVYEGGIHFHDPLHVRDPLDLSLAYLKLFESRGGVSMRVNALAVKPPLRQGQSVWTFPFKGQTIQTNNVVNCLGPWGQDWLANLGLKRRTPLFVKRGYHQHFALASGMKIHHPVFDADGGFLLAPMQNGVRLTTGAEFFRRDAAPTYRQITQTLPLARELAPLGSPLEEAAWMGSRPCFPDMLPAIGKITEVEGLWCNFVHQHHGLTLGPVTGLLLSQMASGKTPFTDPAPYDPMRF